MADSANPFSDDFVEEIPKDSFKEQVKAVEQPEDVSPTFVGGVSLDTVAAKLLKDHYVLAALELHTELVESGRELPRLRDYFSNPANFERTKQNEASSPGPYLRE
jgi:hypothetical protein